MNEVERLLAKLSIEERAGVEELDGTERLMVALAGEPIETLRRVAQEIGSLPVRLAMLGLAAVDRAASPLWWGYPPGVFVAYKWDGDDMARLAQDVADHVRGNLGYRVYLDRENLDEDADNYLEVPQYIASIGSCQFYVLLLTEQCGDFLTGRKRKTSWIFDEHQHAVRLANLGRLSIVPALVEPRGATDFYTPGRCLDLMSRPIDFAKFNDVLAPTPVSLEPTETAELALVMSGFDKGFLASEWDLAGAILERNERFKATFDHRFRQMLLDLYTANGPAFEVHWDSLCQTYGRQLVHHLYKGYCAEHEIPVRVSLN